MNCWPYRRGGVVLWSADQCYDHPLATNYWWRWPVHCSAGTGGWTPTDQLTLLVSLIFDHGTPTTCTFRKHRVPRMPAIACSVCNFRCNHPNYAANILHNIFAVLGELEIIEIASGRCFQCSWTDQSLQSFLRQWNNISICILDYNFLNWCWLIVIWWLG